MREIVALLIILLSPISAMYDASSNVVDLTESNFKSLVLDDHSIWVVEFFAPWCGHCKRLVPEYTKLAKALKGLIKVGAVDMTQHQSVGQPYNVQGFPTIKIFGANKKVPVAYQGARTSLAIADAAITELKNTANSRLSGKSDSSSSSSGNKKSPPPGDQKDVIELTDQNFDDLVLKSDDLWLVEFYAPWCGHCKNLAPHWQSAATELKGKVKLGAMDATIHQSTSQRFGVQGFPTIKFFAAGVKSVSDAVDYDGSRTGTEIVSWVMLKVAENIPPPNLEQIVNDDVLATACQNKQLCVVSILPHILDCDAKCRNDYLTMMTKLGEKFRKNLWGWVWAEATIQNELEESFGIGGFGYPAMTALNSRKMKFSILKGPFNFEGISEFLRDLSYGKGQTAPLKGAVLPKITNSEPWDGKDGQVPVEEDIDLSDFDFDEKVEL